MQELFYNNSAAGVVKSNEGTNATDSLIPNQEKSRDDHGAASSSLLLQPLDLIAMKQPSPAEVKRWFDNKGHTMDKPPVRLQRKDRRRFPIPTNVTNKTPNSQAPPP